MKTHTHTKQHQAIEFTSDDPLLFAARSGALVSGWVKHGRDVAGLKK
jgi:hypothetical protein